MRSASQRGVRSLRFEAPIDEVGSERSLRVGHRRAPLLLSPGDALDPKSAHEACDAFSRDAQAVGVEEFGLDAGRAVGAKGLVEDSLDEGLERSVGAGVSRGASSAPGVVARPRHA